jgi:Spy/CpxP family protein refolding chaperone
MRKMTFTAAAIAIVFLASPLLFAKGGEMMGGKKGFDDHQKGVFFGNPDRMKKKLNLTDDQVKQIETINEKYYQQHRAIRDKMRPKMESIRDLMLADKIDTTKVKALFKEIGDLQLENRMLVVQHFIEIESVLTDEQKVKVKRERENLLRGGMMGGY